jgi:tetratricopeptide (TPR) repeat protein
MSIFFSFFIFLSLHAQQPAPDLVSRLEASVVTLRAFDGAGQVTATRSGFLLEPGVLVTSRHALAGAARVEVRLASGAAGRLERVLGEFPEVDVLLAEARFDTEEPPGLTPLGRALGAHEDVLALGGPPGPCRACSGMLVAARRTPLLDEVLETSFDLPPEWDGGLLVTTRGEAAGLLLVRTLEGRRAVFAVPLARVVALKLGAPVGLADWRPDAGPRSGWPRSEAWLEGAGWLWAGECKRALPSLERSAAAFPQVAPAVFFLGLCRDRAGDHAGALEAFKTAVRLEPAFVEGHAAAGDALMQLRYWEKAVRAFQEALRLRPEDVPARLSLAVALANLGRTLEALVECNRAVKAAPERGETQVVLANLQARLGRGPRAVEAARKAVKLNPDSPAARAALGGALLVDGKPEEARQAYREALARAPEDVEARIGLGTAHLRLGEWSDAEKAFRRALRVSEDSVGAWYGLGLTHLQTGNERGLDKALEALDRLDPDQAEALRKEVRKRQAERLDPLQ